MTITYVGTGVPVSSRSTSFTVGLPSGVQPDDQLLLRVACKPSARSGSADAAWTQSDSETGGSGANGGDTGTIKAYGFHKPGSSTTAATFTWSGTSSGNPAMASTFAFRKSNAGAWDLGVTTFDDTSQSTAADGIGGVFISNPGIQTGDMLVLTYGAPTDSGSIMNPRFEVPGCTVETPTVALDFSTVEGNDGTLYVVFAKVTSGTATGAAAFYATTDNANKSSGPLIMTRLREPVAQAVGQQVTRWDGTQEIPVTVTRWTGTEEVPVTLSLS